MYAVNVFNYSFSVKHTIDIGIASMSLCFQSNAANNASNDMEKVAFARVVFIEVK